MVVKFLLNQIIEFANRAVRDIITNNYGEAKAEDDCCLYTDMFLWC